MRLNKTHPNYSYALAIIILEITEKTFSSKNASPCLLLFTEKQQQKVSFIFTSIIITMHLFTICVGDNPLTINSTSLMFGQNTIILRLKGSGGGILTVKQTVTVEQGM